MSDVASRGERDCWVGFDLGGTKMTAAVLDGEMKPLGKERKKTKGHEGVDTVLERIVKTIRDALEDAKVEPARLAGIGVGMPRPGSVEWKRRLIRVRGVHMGINAQAELKSLHEFITQKLQTQNTALTPEQAVAQWRERQETIASAQRGIDDLDAGRVKPADEVLDRLGQGAK